MAERKHWFRNAAACYVWMVPLLGERARSHGYALAVHGSMQFDLDLVCIPWTDDAVEPEVLITALRSSIGWTDRDGPWSREEKPHGRIAWIVPLGVGLALDISVLPPVRQCPQQTPATSAGQQGETANGTDSHVHH